jgi:hypothetical protein
LKALHDKSCGMSKKLAKAALKRLTIQSGHRWRCSRPKSVPEPLGVYYPPTTHSDGLAKRQSASEALPRPILKLEPGCCEATPAAFPDYFGRCLAALVDFGPRLVLRSAKSSDDCFHLSRVLKGCGSKLAGIFVWGLPGSNRSELVTLPSAPTKLILTERSSATVGVRASSRSNRRKRFLVVIFVSLRHGGAYVSRCAITPL